MATNEATLLLIDVQQGFDDPSWGERNNLRAEDNISALLSYWRLHRRPVVHVQHCSDEANSPLRAGSSGCSFKHEAAPQAGEIIFQKVVNSAFIGTKLESVLHKSGTKSLVVAGFTTDHCVSTTVRMAANLGFEVFLVHDATATFARQGYDGRNYTAEEIHQTALASLHGEFAVVLSTEEVLARD